MVRQGGDSGRCRFNQKIVRGFQVNAADLNRIAVKPRQRSGQPCIRGFSRGGFSDADAPAAKEKEQEQNEQHNTDASPGAPLMVAVISAASAEHQQQDNQ
jgi:hypothetical protein